ncbi:MAG: reactive intermediate/imine deaminase [Candidatus Zixiibacteriota bacterium]|nr:MAG: reactive intermediate/imine deaminase [candidate division Zixibacteria bacterium]
MKKIIKTENAPQAIGPYSQAVQISNNNLLFLSGQIPLDPKTMEIVGNTASEQCKQVMDNITAVVGAAGSDMSDIVKTTIYLCNMNDFASVNEMYATYFDSNPPARATVEVSRLPKDVKVEIEAIVIVR